MKSYVTYEGEEFPDFLEKGIEEIPDLFPRLIDADPELWSPASMRSAKQWEVVGDRSRRLLGEIAGSSWSPFLDDRWSDDGCVWYGAWQTDAMPTPLRLIGWACVVVALTACAPAMTPEQEAVAHEVCLYAEEVDDTTEAQARGEAYSAMVATATASVGVEEGPGDLPPELYEILLEEDFTGSYDAVPRILDWCRDNDLPTAEN